MGIGTVSFVLGLLSFVAEFLCLRCSAFFSADPLIGVAVMGRVTVGQVMDLDCPVWILGGFKTVLGLVAEMCIPPCFGVCNRLGSGGPCELLLVLSLVPPLRLRCLRFMPLVHSAPFSSPVGTAPSRLTGMG